MSGNEVRIRIEGENKASPAFKGVADDAAAAGREVRKLTDRTKELGDAGGKVKASPAIKAVADDARKAEKEVRALSERTDALDESSSHATSALGALGSGFELIGQTGAQQALESAALATDFFSGVGEGATLVLDKFKGGLSGAKEGLAKFRANMGDASSTAGKFTTAAIAAGAAIAALVAANAVLNATLKDKVNISLHDTVAGLNQIAATGTVNNDSLRGLSSNTKQLGDDLDTLNSGLLQTAENFAHTGWFASDKVFGNDIENSRKRLKGLDDALTQMVQNGQADQAASAFQVLTEQAKAQGVSVDELKKGLPGYTEAAKNAADANTGLADQTMTAVDALNQQDDAINEVANSLKAQTDPLFGYIDAQATLTEKQDDYNKAVKTHGRNSKEAAAASDALNRALISMVSSAGKASNGTGHLTAEQKALLSSAGASKQRIKELDAQLYAAWRQANKLDGFNIDINYNQHFRMFGKPYSQAAINSGQVGGLAHGGVKGAASGMAGSGLTWVGEQGPELVSLPTGSTVHSSPDSTRMAGTAASGPIELIVRPAPGADRGLMQMLIEALRFEVRTQGGGNAQLFFGGRPA